MPLYDRILSVFARLARDRHASIAPTFALLLLPLLGLMGMAIDVSSMLAERTRMQNIADAGALDYLRYIKSYMDTNGNTYTNYNAIDPTALTNATNFMNGLAIKETALVKDSVTNAANISASSTYNASTGTVTTKTTVKALYQTSFMGLFNVPSVEVDTEASTSATLSKFTQVIFLVDVSGSMGVAGDDTALASLPTLISNVSGGKVQGCVFACHQYVNNTGPSAYYAADFRTLAAKSNPPIKLKIDYAQSAVSDFISKMVSASGNYPAGHLNTSIYTFSGTLNTVMPSTNVSTSTSNTINGYVNNIDLDVYQGDNYPSSGLPYYGGTSISTVLQDIQTKLTNVGAGDGSSPNDQLTYLILVTDGVEDVLVPGYGCCGHYTDTTWVSNCTPIKNLNVNIATVQAQYLYYNDPDGTFANLVLPIYDQIQPAMATCASQSNLALSASDGPGLEAAVASLFGTIVPSPRLTQ